MEKQMIVKKENIFVKVISFIKRLFCKNLKKDTYENIPESSITVEKDKSFLKELRKGLEGTEEIEELNKDVSKLYDMSMEELENIHEIIKERKIYFDKKISELQYMLENKKSDTNNM